MLGLPAGRTPVGDLRRARRLHAAGEADFSRATTFELDEFVGIDHNASRQLSSIHPRAPVRARRISRAIAFTLNGAAGDLDAECERYEAAIQRAGGIGLQLLGIGTNGHIGFNEPATSCLRPRIA